MQKCTLFQNSLKKERSLLSVGNIRLFTEDKQSPVYSPRCFQAPGIRCEMLVRSNMWIKVMKLMSRAMKIWEKAVEERRLSASSGVASC